MRWAGCAAQRSELDRSLQGRGLVGALLRELRPLVYNQRPAWLAQAHSALDAAVAAAYGWADYTSAMTDDEILRRLLELNLGRVPSR